MELEQYFEFVSPDEIKLKGHRIGIEHVVELYHSGYTAEQIGQAFPGVDLEAIYATITYYLHNRAAIDSYIHRQDARSQAEYEEWAAQPNPTMQRLKDVLAERRRQSA